MSPKNDQCFDFTAVRTKVCACLSVLTCVTSIPPVFFSGDRGHEAVKLQMGGFLVCQCNSQPLIQEDSECFTNRKALAKDVNYATVGLVASVGGSKPH